MKNLVISVLLLVLMGCGGARDLGTNGRGGTPAPDQIAVAGNWSISGTSSESGEAATLSGSLRQNGTTLDGTVAMAVEPCGIEQLVRLTGTAIGRSVSLTLQQSNMGPISFNGMVTADGNHLQGTFSGSSLGCSTATASGSFTGLRIPSLAGTWAGNFQPRESSQTAFSVAAIINQDPRGNLTGSVKLTSPCLTEANITGMIHGLDVVLAGSDSVGDTITFNGTTNNDGTQLTLDYILNGSPSARCETDAGAGSMARQ